MSTIKIVSHLPGIFYRAPSPEEPAYKNEGDEVEQGDTIGIIEVMKSFHTVASDSSGKIIRYLVENEEEVMAGQPIVELDGKDS